MPLLLKYKKDILFLIFLCVAGGLFSLSCGQDVSWDLLNYHLYTPFAWLNGKWATDATPAGIHTFLNPVLDTPYYLLVKHLNNWPKLTAFLQGLPLGVFWFAGYKTCLLFLKEKQGKLPAVLAALIGLTGSMALSQAGFSSNEATSAAILTCATYLLFSFLFYSPQSRTRLFFAAFLAGTAAGLKYTAAPFTLAITAVFILNLFKTQHPLKNFLLFAAGGIAGFLAADGWFAWHLWSEYKNPVFPFFNGVFKSPFFENINFDETRFYPRTLIQWIAYPFFWIFPSTAVTEVETADPRLALGYIAFVIMAFKLAWGKLTEKRRMWISALLFTASGYICWLKIYAILRYAIPLELFSGILLMGVLRTRFPYKTTALIGTVLAVCLWPMTEIPNWGRDVFDKQTVAVRNLPKVEPNSLVIYFGAPMAFLSQFFTPGTKFAGGVHFPVEKYPQEYQPRAQQRNVLPDAYYSAKFQKNLTRTIMEHNGPIYIVAVPWPMMLDPITLAPYGLQAGKDNCVFFNANINLYSRGWNLCKVEKI